MTPPSPTAVPQMFVEYFVKAYAAFVDAVRAAITENVANPAVANTAVFLSWQTQALPLLEKQNAAINEAFARYLIGEEQTIVALAADRRHLAKELDGLPLTFAGPERAQTLGSLKTAAVVTASRLCTAAGIR